MDRFLFLAKARIKQFQTTEWEHVYLDILRGNLATLKLFLHSSTIKISMISIGSIVLEKKNMNN